MKLVGLALTLALAFGAAADDPPVTKPISYTWIVTSCETWNCAAAALVLADGDKYVIVLPTGEEDRPWLILKRVEEGSVYVPEDEPFVCEIFESVDGAATHFSTIDSCHGPMVLNVPDGRAVVLSRSVCHTSKRRAAG